MKNKVLILILISISIVIFSNETSQNRFNQEISPKAKAQNILTIIDEGVIIFTRNMLCFFRDPNLQNRNRFLKNSPFGKITKITEEFVEIEIPDAERKIKINHNQIIEIKTPDGNCPF